MNKAARILKHLKHLFIPRRHVGRPFSDRTLHAIEESFIRCEATHTGQLRVAIEGSLD